MLKFLAALAVLLLALFLQLLFASAGFYLDLTLAALIAFAFAFDFWELLIFDLLAVFILNWQPVPSVAIISFALIPLAAFAFRTLTRWHGWMGDFIATLCGFVIFYLLNAYLLNSTAQISLAAAYILPFLLDAAIGILVSEAIFFIFASPS